MTPEFLKANVADVISGSTLEVIENSGHYAPLDQPALLAKRIARFVDEL
jgi:pimeloyl-ACP methyl ester carboxylesterase